MSSFVLHRRSRRVPLGVRNKGSERSKSAEPGVKDILIACVDGLKGFPEAIEAIYPRTEVQLCIVHLVRASLNYVPWKMRKPCTPSQKQNLAVYTEELTHLPPSLSPLQ